MTSQLVILSLLASIISTNAIPTPLQTRQQPPQAGIPDAVAAFPGLGVTTPPSSITEEGWALEPTETSSLSGLGLAQVLAVGDPEQVVPGQGAGHWQVYTTSTWIADASPSPASSAVTAVTSAAVQEHQDPNWGISLCLGYGTDCSPSPSTTLLPPVITSSQGQPQLPPSPVSPLPPVTSTSTSVPAPSPGGGSGGPVNPAKQIFAHFMVGIVSTYKQADWEYDINVAKSKGITGFALNIGVDPYSQEQLDLAYAAGDAIGGFEMFISFDFNWYKIGDVSGVATMMKRYVDRPSQFLVDGKPFVSSFIGDGFDWSAAAAQIGREIYAMPFFQPSADVAKNPGISGLFSWAAWPGQLDNQPIEQNMTLNRDDAYLDVLLAEGKQYMAPISPWFNTHFGTEVPYAKNWLFYSEQLWKTRWDQILELGQKGVNFVEIVTWNDYGESHHIGPYHTPHTDDGSSKWAEGLDHTAMLDFSVPYIEAFKRGSATPIIDKEMLVYWHRPHLKSAQCDATDNCGGKPTGWEMVEDVVFVATMTKSGGTVNVQSGSQPATQRTVEAGVQVFQVPMGVGIQQFSFQTAQGKTGAGSSNVSVTDTCWNGIYNFNFHSGSIA